MLTQRRLLTTLSFAVSDDGVEVTERCVTFTRSYRVPFGHIPSSAERLSICSKGWLAATIGFAVVAIAASVDLLPGVDTSGAVWMAWAFVAVLTGVMAATSRSRFLIFRSNSAGLVLLDGRPTAGDVDAFLDEMHRRRVAWLGEQALLTSGDTPGDLNDRLVWLCATGFLSADERDQLVAGLAQRAVLRPTLVQ